MHRSYLFAPGHNEKLLRRVFEAGADAVLLDLEDAVPPHAKKQARAMVAEVLPHHQAWVRINAVGTDLAAADLASVADLAAGIRVPKVESSADVEWVRERATTTPDPPRRLHALKRGGGMGADGARGVRGGGRRGGEAA